MDGTNSRGVWGKAAGDDEAIAEEFVLDDEAGRVRDWRARQLQRLGLDAFLAYAFATDVDWHDAAALVERGCSPELAVDILR